MNYWLVKSEPFVYSWDQLVNDGKVVWDGVRNYQARNNLAAMKKGDSVLFYHSNEGLCVVGIAEVKKEKFQDPTSDDARWVSVELSPKRKISKPVLLATIKSDKILQNIGLIKQSRLSVINLSKQEFERIVQLGK